MENATTEKNRKERAFVVGDYDTLKVIADPLRTQVVELLIAEPLNVRQVAERLGLAPSKLYYHFGLLEKIGLIEVADTRLTKNIVEKTYRAAYGSVTVDPSLLNFGTDAGKENIYTALMATLDATREDVLRSLQARAAALDQGAPKAPRGVIISRQLSRMSEERAAEFRQRLEALMQAFDEADGDDARLTAYALGVAFYPSFYFRDEAPGQATPPPDAASVTGE
jgi:DNA-binding transcriptional ArsR family regulator